MNVLLALAAAAPKMDIGAALTTLVVTIIVGAGVVTTAMFRKLASTIDSIKIKQIEIQDDSKAIRNQTENHHGTNLRNDIDAVRDSLDRITRSLERTDAEHSRREEAADRAMEGIREDIRPIREEMMQLRMGIQANGIEIDRLRRRVDNLDLVKFEADTAARRVGKGIRATRESDPQLPIIRIDAQPE